MSNLKIITFPTKDLSKVDIPSFITNPITAPYNKTFTPEPEQANKFFALLVIIGYMVMSYIVFTGVLG